MRDTDHRDDLALVLSWRFEGFGLGSRARLEEKRAQLRQVALERERLRATIAAEVRAEHARLVSLRAQLEPAELAVVRARQAYALHRERIFDGQGMPLEALTAMQSLATAELAYLEVTAGYSLAQLRLYTALGGPLDTQF
ncbi:MAG TPA: TolC family protein [Gammaproteobacteria bacterium]